MGGGLMAMITKMLGGGMGGMMGGMGGAGGMMGGAGGGAGDFDKGMMHGMSFGGGGGGGSSHIKNTKDIDHELGLSALKHYQDMSHPDYSGINQGMSFANNIRPGQSFIAPPQQSQPNQYVQALLSGMRGGR